jgi:uncharacterized membrane protein
MKYLPAITLALLVAIGEIVLLRWLHPATFATSVLALVTLAFCLCAAVYALQSD